MRRLGGRLGRIVIGLLVLYVVSMAGLVAVMQNPVVFGKLMARVPAPVLWAMPYERLWMVARAGHLKVGDVGPDFFLFTADKKSRVRLSSFRGQKPVVLVFGSYT